MLYYFRLKKELQETNSIVSFETADGFRVDISKKFIKKDPISERWYFTKSASNIRTLKDQLTITYITFGEVYIIEQSTTRRPVGANLVDIIIVKDLISLQEVNQYRGAYHAEETYRS